MISVENRLKSNEVDMKLFVIAQVVFIIFTSNVYAQLSVHTEEEEKKGPKSFTVEIKKDELNAAQLFEKQLIQKQKTNRKKSPKRAGSKRPSRGGGMSNPTLGGGMFVK